MSRRLLSLSTALMSEVPRPTIRGWHGLPADSEFPSARSSRLVPSLATTFKWVRINDSESFLSCIFVYICCKLIFNFLKLLFSNVTFINFSWFIVTEEVSIVLPDAKNSSEKVVPDSEQISEIEQKLEQDIIKLKLSLKTLSMPFMKNNLEITDDVPSNEDVGEAVEKDECELRTVVIQKEIKVPEPEKHEVVADGNVDNVVDVLKALQDYNDDGFDANAGEHYMDHEFVKEGRKDDDADADDEAGEKHDDEDDDDDMDDDLADQIVLRCLQPSFMSPHVKLDSLGHLQSSENVQEIDRRINPNVHYVDFLALESSFNTSSDCYMKIKEELNIKSEPVEFPETFPRENAKLLKRQSEYSLESGEILTPSLTPELSGGGKDDFGNVGNRGTEHQETLVISDNETEESSVIIVEDLCVIPMRRCILNYNFHLTVIIVNEMPSFVAGWST